MKVFSNLSVRNKLILLTLTIGLGSVAIVGWLSSDTSAESLQDQTTSSLEAIRIGKADQIEDYFGFIHEQIFNFAQNRMVTEATAKFSQAFIDVVEETGLDSSSDSDVYAAVKGYYTGEFKPRLDDAAQPWRGDTTYVPELASGRILQSFYIANNPNPVGEKLNLDRSPEDCEYNRLHAIYHPPIRSFLNSFGYYDIFLFDLDGNMVYSVFKETDYATNFLDGPYKDTNFGDVYRKCLVANQPGTVVIEDFKHYEPSYGAPASFTGAPVFHDGEKVGVAIFQMPVDKIAEIMGGSAGLGKTGQAFLVGRDHLMRSNSRFSEDGETTVLSQKIQTDAVEHALNGETETRVVTNYRGHSAIGSFAPLDMEGLDWAIVVEQETNEANAATRALQHKITIVGAAVAAAVVVVAFLFSTALVRPIAPVLERAKKIAAGDLTGGVLPVKSRDEFGQLTGAMNEMHQGLRSLVAAVSESANEVSKAATDIASSSEEMSRGMGDQDLQIKQVASAIEKMSASIVEVVRKSGDAAGSANESGTVAQKGGEVVDQTIQGMNAINEAVTAGAAAVAELGKRGEQIGQIIEVINDIADQTNLLALNAAIEAARAGEHGRGFAVVADEVRKLADRTTKATDEIAGSIKAIQEETNEAVQRMDGGTDQVRSGVERATEAGESLKQIVNKAKEVSGMIQSIAAAAEQQSTASEEVSRSISSIQSIAAEAEQGATQSAESVSGLTERASQLQSVLSQFKISNDPALRKWDRGPDELMKILLVDDDPSILRLLEGHLKDFGECHSATNGNGAISTFRSMLDQDKRFEVIFLDIKLPDTDGRKVLAQFREAERSVGISNRKRAKIIMVTALDTPQDKLQAFREACEGYITKPFDKTQILQILEGLAVTSQQEVGVS